MQGTNTVKIRRRGANCMITRDYNMRRTDD